MLRTISTHIFLRQRLHPGLLDSLAKGGAQAIEIFAARQHFDYTAKPHVKEIALWFAANPVEPFSMHMPLFGDTEMGRSGAPAVNVVHPEKSRRIDAMDEVKRALETAEEMPLRYLILHLGEREDRWSPRTLEHAMTAIEHLQAFARPLGVKLLLENITERSDRFGQPGGDRAHRPLQRRGRMSGRGPCAHRRWHCRGHRRVEAAHPVHPYP